MWFSPARSLQAVCFLATGCFCLLGCFKGFASGLLAACCAFFFASVVTGLSLIFFWPCWPDYRRFFAAVCANFQIQILNLKLKIRGAGEGDGDGDGRWGWGWGWDG